MLSRTASNLYWIARYMERAETSARLLEVGARNALMPNIGGGMRNEWESVLNAHGTLNAFLDKYGDPVQRNVETFLFFDRENPSSIASCISAARENARIVRTALTTQMWDAINTAFQEVREMERTERSALPLSDLVEWTLRVCALVRGTIDATLLRNDGYHFLQLGYFIERADNTARLLDVKYYVLLPQVSMVGSGLDNFQWGTLLRALSAHRAFNWAYGGEITARKIADFLILNRQCPRSIYSCVSGITDHLDAVARGYGKSSAAQTQSRAMLAELAEMRVDHIFDEGMHEFLSRVIGDVNRLGFAVHDTYLSGDIK
ncbi:hypothetical protein AQS8620_01275 [Aquimixticola soesokkakensis]|uniref:DUF403 domain-containing protein n=1 Tax=Aquimixticola soesokkakensis TaxID=1519096 RepID=A0A1Y5SA58_9RHOB|nr:alpha-E domain-containing protein [Aquimixticola soesokkakensis]SLN36021.1 hypothetical protein AQS8620_01275 [Aquimixticola soesokkakensis]